MRLDPVSGEDDYDEDDDEDEDDDSDSGDEEGGDEDEYDGWWQNSLKWYSFDAISTDLHADLHLIDKIFRIRYSHSQATLRPAGPGDGRAPAQESSRGLGDFHVRYIFSLF